MHAGMKLDIENLKDEVQKLTAALKEADLKIDDLENRSRRNNLVLFNVPEGMEGKDCAKYVGDLIQEAAQGATPLPNAIQRAHRSDQRKESTGGDAPRPRPIHVGFTRMAGTHHS